MIVYVINSIASGNVYELLIITINMMLEIGEKVTILINTMSNASVQLSCNNMYLKIILIYVNPL